ncbi:MAG: hypothetical protein J6F30_09175, partial [Cellulosilyticum sp.]|nr:hypothetical protein [Cellulosilyticum sp.]
LTTYLQKTPELYDKKKIHIFMILQDFLWSVWTMAKEERGEFFGDYGIRRYERARNLIKEYKRNYA